MKRIQTIALAGSLAFATAAWAHNGAHGGVAFTTPGNGTTLESTFKVEMQVEGMQVHKAGDLIEGTGHFHIIIDGDCIEKGTTVVKDATHIHYGKGQSTSYISLKPGNHTLSLQFADGHHTSYGEDWCQTIHVTVK